MSPDTLIVLGALIVAVLIAAFWITRTIRESQSARPDPLLLTALQNQINSTTQQTAQQMDQLRAALQQIHTQMTQTLDATQTAMTTRLDGTSRAMQDVSKQLGQLDESTKRIQEIGKDMASLQETLRAPKLRGILSELLLDELLAQILPPDRYQSQYTFQGGETVDGVIKLQAGMVPVDAKFPLENFKRLLNQPDEAQKKAARKQFVRDVKSHIDDIASKYIRTDEGTFDFALMYIPAENVYYETIIKEDDSAGDSALLGYALRKRVIPVSPNSFYAYLQTILLGLKGLRIEESAREILDYLARLKKEFEKFSEAFRLVGQHLENSSKKFTEAEKRLTGVEGKMEQIDGVIKGLDAKALPSASDKENDVPSPVGRGLG